jgi:protein-L-isoaspartate(D-aspartate) O-methyltransferase
MDRTILYFVIFFLLTNATAVPGAEEFSEADFSQLRKQMVSQQLERRDITSPTVLKAMAAVPRHLFVPISIRDLSYEDRPLPLGYDQTISQPYIVALMTQLLEISPGDRILEVGTGSGYQAAVLAEMGAEVYSIEIIKELGLRARKTLSDLSYDNVTVSVGDGYEGWPEKAPFSGIIVTCAPTTIPAPLKQQLAEGGRMVIPAGESSNQKLYLLTQKNGSLVQQDIIDVRFVPMVDESGKTY